MIFLNNRPSLPPSTDETIGFPRRMALLQVYLITRALLGWLSPRTEYFKCTSANSSSR